MTQALRQLECQDTAATLPTDALAWQNQANAEVAALWRYISAPLTSVGGTANALTASSDSSVVSAITGYQKGQKFSLIPVTTNTGGMTINIDGLGVKTIFNSDGSVIQGGSVVADVILLIEYDGTNFRVLASGASSGLPSTAPDMIVQDQKSQNTPGGTSTLGSFQTRTLNIAPRNNIPGASLSANQITLPAGTYFVSWSCPAYQVGAHQSILTNVTDSTTIAIGSSASAAVSTADTTLTKGSIYFTLSTAKSFEIRHRGTATQALNGFGLQANFTTELYTEVLIWKVGQLASQVNGVAGGAITLPYLIDLSSTSDSDPGDGNLRFNNATQSSATTLFVDLLGSTLVDYTTVLDQFDASSSTVKGQIRLVKNDDPTKFLDFNFTARTSATGYRKLTVLNIGPTGSPFANGDAVYLAFTRNGDAGSQGVVGSSGLPRGYIDGLILSNDVGTPNTKIDISAGVTRSDDNTTDITLSAFIKSTSAWAAGSTNGGLDIGAVAINTWYAVYAIYNTGSSTADILISNNFSSPTMPSGFTKKRYIGAFRTAIATTNILAFTQVGDEFLWLAPFSELSAAPGTTAAVTVALGGVPAGFKYHAKIVVVVGAVGAGNAVGLISPLDTNDVAPSVTTYFNYGMSITTTAGGAGYLTIRTNASQQIRDRMSANVSRTITTIGFIDQRGKNS